MTKHLVVRKGVCCEVNDFGPRKRMQGNGKEQKEQAQTVAGQLHGDINCSPLRLLNFMVILTVALFAF
ncbi:hypothetical protein AAC387_Pa02g3280 [Persea americana]